MRGGHIGSARKEGAVMDALRLERFMVSVIGLVVATVVGIQVATFVRVEFQKATAVFAVVGKQEVKR